jgi:hypothetical protein
MGVARHMPDTIQGRECRDPYPSIRTGLVLEILLARDNYITALPSSAPVLGLDAANP